MDQKPFYQKHHQDRFKVDRNNLKINQDDYIVSLTSEVNAKNDEITFFLLKQPSLVF